jgi:hypothetical protein
MVCAVSAPVYKVDTTPLYALLAGHHIPTHFSYFGLPYSLWGKGRESGFGNHLKSMFLVFYF